MKLTIGYINREMYADDITMGTATKLAAGIDVRANIPEAITLDSPERTRIPLGLGLEVPEGHMALLVPRSGIGSRGLELINTVGIIDADYRGEVVAFARNKLHGTNAPITIEPGEKIAQLIIVPIVSLSMFSTVNHVPFEDLSTTERGAGGFGSTGKGV